MLNLLLNEEEGGDRWIVLKVTHELSKIQFGEHIDGQFSLQNIPVNFNEFDPKDFYLALEVVGKDEVRFELWKSDLTVYKSGTHMSQKDLFEKVDRVQFAMYASASSYGLVAHRHK